MTEQQKIYLAVGAAVVVYLVTAPRSASAATGGHSSSDVLGGIFGVGGPLGPSTVGGPPPPADPAELAAYQTTRTGAGHF